MEVRTKVAKEKALQKHALSTGEPYFDKCYPMMDAQRSTPNRDRVSHKGSMVFSEHDSSDRQAICFDAHVYKQHLGIPWM